MIANAKKGSRTVPPARMTRKCQYQKGMQWDTVGLFGKLSAGHPDLVRSLCVTAAYLALKSGGSSRVGNMAARHCLEIGMGKVFPAASHQYLNSCIRGSARHFQTFVTRIAGKPWRVRHSAGWIHLYRFPSVRIICPSTLLYRWDSV